MNADQRRAIALGAAATLLYALTAPAVVNPDGLGYLKLLPHNFAAGHLLYMPLLRALTRLLGGDGLAAGRLLDAVLGGSGVVLMYGVTRRALSLLPLGRPYELNDVRLAATLAAAGLAVSYGWWVQGADLEAYALAAVALLATVRMALAYRAQPSLVRALATGVLLGVAVLTHLTHVLLSLFVVAALTGARDDRSSDGARLPSGRVHAALALGSGGVIALLAYAWATLHVRGHDLSGALAWIATASHGFAQEGGLYRISDAVAGLAKALVWSPYVFEADAQKMIGQLLMGLLPLVLFTALVLSRRRALPPLPWRAGLWWVIPYAAMGVCFFGADSERWLFVLPALWLAAAALIVLLPRRRLVAVALVLYLGVTNLVFGIGPAHRDDSIKRRAEAAAALLSDGDLAVFPGHSWDEYVGFFGARRIEPFPIVYYAARDGIDACFERLSRDAERVRAAGGRVVPLRVFDEEEHDPRGWDELAALGLPRHAVRARLKGLSIDATPRVNTAP